MDIEEYLRTVAENLLTLEVNTILKPQITGKKMPPPEQAVFQLAGLYVAELDRLGVPAQQIAGASAAAFTEIAARAKGGIGKLQAGGRDEDSTLRRIIGGSEAIASLLDAVARRAGSTKPPVAMTAATAHQSPLELMPDEIVVLRKLWDIGLERIIFQTCVQLDGDVVTRIQTGFAEPTSANKQLLAIHNESVQTSVQFWKGLMELLGAFLKGAGTFIRGH